MQLRSQLHEHFYELPAPIREYIQEVKAQLAMLTDWPDAGIELEEKLSFFKETRHAYGRTALLLSGGGGLGSFHIGVVKALFEHTMLPRVVAGSSVGSIVAGMIATRTDDELRETFRKLDNIELSFFNNSRAVELVHSFLQKGALHDMSYLQRKLKALIGNYTFLEAVCPADTNEPARLLNYLTAPQALIWSAVAASSAFPGLFHPQDLLARNAHGEEVRFNAPSLSNNVSRRWRDGSLELDLPTFLLSEMFNCNHFIVSQTNPHIAPLLNLKKSLSRRWANLLELELRHRCAQMQYILPDWFPTKWLTLFTQPWEGDVTVVLPSHLWNLGKTMVNPTTHDILAATKQGELAIWEKLSAIEANCTIEATLDACLARLTNKVRERPLTGLTSRIPSWLSMPAVGQQAVASWGNPLDAGASPGGRLWNRSKSSQALLNGSSGHLPALLQAQQAAQQVQQGSAAAGPAAVGHGGAWYFAGGNAALSASTLLASAGVGGAVHTGDAAAAGAAGSAAIAIPAGLYGGVPATVSDAIAAMADDANMGGTHRGYSYTAAALHSAHMQQHGSPAVAAAHAQAAAAAVAAHTGMLHGSLAGTAYGGSGGGSGFLDGSSGNPGFMSSVGGGDGSAATVSMPSTIHEGMPDDGPPRVSSWGSNTIADSVSDFPSTCSGGGYGAAGSGGSSRASRAHQQALAAAAVAVAAAAAASRRAGQDGAAAQQQEQPGTPDSLETVGSSAAASGGGASRLSKGSRRRSSASSTCSSGSSGSSPVHSDIAGQLDCCDSSVVTDIWSMFMPLATSSLALQAATSEGLDFIAP
ncbi:acyl transferase/acyl hydrolase/lysophospholipase [Scenedesmus sp. NREL 46B-D3]|nr:acyl transferase/acyl hydrolase/lysophospholipase [Scenedesmus sp. NREL 46B-D3]